MDLHYFNYLNICLLSGSVAEGGGGERELHESDKSDELHMGKKQIADYCTVRKRYSEATC